MFATESQRVGLNLFLIASVFFVEVFMDADMPTLAKVWLAAQGASLFIKVLKKRQSANYTIWSVVFVILYQTH